MPRRPTRYYPDYGPWLLTSGPDWCWRRAEEIVRLGQHVSLPRDGPHIARAVGLIRASLRSPSGRQMRQLLRQDPSLVMAAKLHAAGERCCLELECRLLARQSAGVIAIEMGLTYDIVETYGRLFFDVSDRLDRISYMMQRVLPAPREGPMPVETLMRRSCYFHGPAAIARWFDFLDHQGESHDLSTPVGRVRESMELFVAAQNLPRDAATTASCVKHSHRIIAMRQEMFLQRSLGQALAANVAEMLAQVPWKPPVSAKDRQAAGTKRVGGLRIFQPLRKSA